jgi:predicted GNAT family N-acyltransferase
VSGRQAEPDFSIEPLNAKHERERFRCGVPELDRYLHKLSGQDTRKRAARVYVATTDGRRVLGYYTLSAYSVDASDIPQSMMKRMARYRKVPAILLGRLAVHESKRGGGLGRTLLVDALQNAASVAEKIGAAVVVVDAKDDAAREFYRHFNFVSLTGEPDTLVLPIGYFA